MANEKRLIELDELIDNIDWDNDLQKWALRGEPEDIPTVDAVEVVRCKDCKYWVRDGSGYCDDESSCRNPDGLDNIARPDDFCSYGERKEDGKE